MKDPAVASLAEDPACFDPLNDGRAAEDEDATLPETAFPFVADLPFAGFDETAPWALPLSAAGLPPTDFTVTPEPLLAGVAVFLEKDRPPNAGFEAAED